MYVAEILHQALVQIRYSPFMACFGFLNPRIHSAQSIAFPIDASLFIPVASRNKSFIIRESLDLFIAKTDSPDLAMGLQRITLEGTLQRCFRVLLKEETWSLAHFQPSFSPFHPAHSGINMKIQHRLQSSPRLLPIF
jgi:hypothetical protein